MDTSQAQSRRLHRIAVVLAGTAVLGVAAVALVDGRTDASAHHATGSQRAAEGTFVRAVTLLQTVGVPPNASVDRAPTAADIARMNADGKSQISAVFTPSARREGTLRLNTSTQLVGSDVRALGGGVSAVRYDAVVPHADGSYTITAHVTAWAKLAQIHDGHAAVATPSNLLIVTATLVPSGRSYLIDSYSWKFAPGSGP